MVQTLDNTIRVACVPNICQAARSVGVAYYEEIMIDTKIKEKYEARYILAERHSSHINARFRIISNLHNVHNTIINCKKYLLFACTLVLYAVETTNETKTSP